MTIKRLKEDFNLFEKALEASKDEREIVRFLKDHTSIILQTFSTSFNERLIFPEFKLGNEYSVDFLLMCANSGSWHAHFIEFENPTSRLTTKAGVPTETLRIAERQISDWKHWLRTNDKTFREALAKKFRQKKTPAQCSKADDHQSAHSEIIDPKTVYTSYFHIVIGRRATLTDKDQKHRTADANTNSWYAPEIVTYDRLLDGRKKINAP